MKIAEMCSRTLRHLADELDGQAKYAREQAQAFVRGKAFMEAFWDGVATRAKSNARDYRRKALKAEKAQQKREHADG